MHEKKNNNSEVYKQMTGKDWTVIPDQDFRLIVGLYRTMIALEMNVQHAKMINVKLCTIDTQNQPI